MKTIAIHLRLATASHRKRLMGIFRFLGADNTWDIRIIPTEEALCKLLKAKRSDDRPDGIISGIPYSERTRLAIAQSDVPFVGIGMDEHELPEHTGLRRFVLNDNEGIGTAAANYFLSLGKFRSFAFIPDAHGRKWSDIRGKAFSAAIKAHGQVCQVYKAIAQNTTTLSRFIEQLPKPAAVFAAWDGQGADVIHAAHASQLRVPEDISVLGVDNDELICDHTVPTLSSIQTDAEGMGETAARMLVESIGHDANLPTQTVSCRILGIAERSSTQTPSPVTDLLQRALTFIESEAVNGITPDDVARHLKISRRLLDLRFNQYASSSVAEYITRRKLEEVKRLLVSSQLQVKEIFKRSGFGNITYATSLFRKTEGMTPEDWRRQQH